LERSANKTTDVLASLPTTLAPGAKESIIVLVCDQWVITSPEDRNEQEVKRVSIHKINKED